jgi:hypothetical protein
MSVLRVIIASGLLVAGTLSALGDATPVDMATQTACNLDRVREIIAGAEASSTTAEEANRLIVENTADWLPDYAAFATGPEVGDLRAAAEAEPLSAAACKALLPFAAVSASAARISQAGATVEAGGVLEACADGKGLCIPAATDRILTQCGAGLFKLPLRGTC